MIVDVIMPVRNGERYIEVAIESLRCQTEQSWRLLVLDHNSTDSTASIVKRIARFDKRINLVDAAGHEDVSTVRNAGFSLCEADFIMLQDADDISLPERVAVSLRAFDSNPDAIAIGGQAYLIDSNGARRGQINRSVGRDRISAAAVFCNPIAHPTVIFCRSGVIDHRVTYGADFLSAAKQLRIDQFSTIVEDYFLFSQLATLGKLANIPNKLIQYRLHENSTSSRNRRAQISRSLSVSRYIVRLLAARHGLDYVDPAPLCNHCGQIYSLPPNYDAKETYINLSQLLRTAFGASEGLERELSYRRSIATRNAVMLLLRHVAFRAQHDNEMDEASAIREWFLGPIKGRPHIEATPDNQYI